jgi:hypothetical protein
MKNIHFSVGNHNFASKTRLECIKIYFNQFVVPWAQFCWAHSFFLVHACKSSCKISTPRFTRIFHVFGTFWWALRCMFTFLVYQHYNPPRLTTLHFVVFIEVFGHFYTEESFFGWNEQSTFKNCLRRYYYTFHCVFRAIGLCLCRTTFFFVVTTLKTAQG